MSVVVLGMHRSGTSAATRVISLLGVPLCRPGDLVRTHRGNDLGHWESAPLVAENERLLGSLGSSWWCPPQNTGEVAAMASDVARVDAARTVFTRSFPSLQWVWKEPRTSLLLPFWRRALPCQPVVILTCRSPGDVAASMLSRDQISLRFGLALWERYTSLALDGAHGLPVLVTSYDDLLQEPVRWASRTVGFLRDHGVDAQLPADCAGLRAFISQRPATRSPVAAEADRMATSMQRDLWQYLRDRASAALDGAAEPPSPDPATLTLMNEVREAFGLIGGSSRVNGTPCVSSGGVPVWASRRSAPKPAPARVSVVLMPVGRAATISQARALRPWLPPDAEIITVADAADKADGHGDRASSWFLRVQRDRYLPLVQKVNLAAAIAQGTLLIIMAGPQVTPRRGWLPSLRAALALPDCAVACPALFPPVGEPAYGLDPDPHFLTASWVTSAPQRRRPFPVGAASIAAMATTRRAFESVGGFDEGLTGEGCEDVDYCVRLQRAGWRCLAVPTAHANMEFQTLPASPADLMANALRLGIVHLDTDELAAQLAELSGSQPFAEALSRVSVHDAGRRRRIVQALSWYETGRVLGPNRLCDAGET